jgi:betaine-aldehyde dehydrogenase
MSVVSEFLKESYDLWIGGEPRPARSGGVFNTCNPYNNEPIASVANGNAQDVLAAVDEAERAHRSGRWSGLSAGERGQALMRVGWNLRQRLAEFATVETLDNGKPLRESEGDVLAAADCFEYYGGMATKILGQVTPVPGPYFSFTRHEPVGVVGQITPWNFPVLMAAWKLAPALAVGNTVVLKPSPLTPLTTLMLAELMGDAGIPSGVVNVVTGEGTAAGEAIVDDPRVRKIAFTGSTRTGRAIVERGSSVVRMVSLELGGKSPMIVFDDADLEAAVRNALFGIFFAQGENCTATSRVLVQQGVYEHFVEAFVDQAKRIVVGNGLDTASQMGPLISPAQLAAVEAHVERGRTSGARLALGGVRPADPDLKRGNFLLPTVFAEVPVESGIWREEIFGPVVSLRSFENEAEGVALANDTTYGLAAAVFTRDIERALRAASALEAGYVWINCNNLSPSESPFGGFKDSGVGRELGTYAMDLYTEVKSVCVSLDGSTFDWYGTRS